MSINIFNPNNTTVATSLFLGEPLGIFDSINKPFPDIFRLYKKMKSMDWDENEWPYEICNAQFKRAKASDYKRMLNTLSWQWETDSVAARCLFPVVAPYISNSELQAAWQLVSANETVHALTYSEIVRYSFDDPNEVMSYVMGVKEAQARMQRIVDIFDNAFEVGHRVALGEISRNDPRAYYAIMMFTCALFALERIQFMDSFAVTYAQSLYGDFLPIVSAIQKIQTDEFELHQVLDRTILTHEFKTQRGRDFFEDNKKEIKELIYDVRNTEIDWNTNVLYADGTEAPKLNLTELNGFVDFNTTDVMDFFGFNFKERVDTPPLHKDIMSKFNMNKRQIAPMEERGGNYQQLFIKQVRDPKYDVTNLLGNTPRTSFTGGVKPSTLVARPTKHVL